MHANLLVSKGLRGKSYHVLEEGEEIHRKSYDPLEKPKKLWTIYFANQSNNDRMVMWMGDVGTPEHYPTYIIYEINITKSKMSGMPEIICCF